MAEIDVAQDLGTVTEQVQKMGAQLQEMDSQRAVLVQQFQNLNGVLMYLRGKTENPELADTPFVTGEAEDDTKET